MYVAFLTLCLSFEPSWQNIVPFLGKGDNDGPHHPVTVSLRPLSIMGGREGERERERERVVYVCVYECERERERKIEKERVKVKVQEANLFNMDNRRAFPHCFIVTSSGWFV